MTSNTLSADYYRFLLNTPSGTQWRRVGARRRSGVAVPLFSLHSTDSVGVGEIPDLNRFVDWCASAGFSVVQLLPLNDVGFDFQPYSAQSSFALEPLYLSLKELKEVDLNRFEGEMETLRLGHPAGRERVNYGTKAAKLKLLWKMFQVSFRPESGAFQRFIRENSFWLHDYALFRAIKETQEEKNWEVWEAPLKNRHPDRLKEFEREHGDRVRFREWLQWQLFEQFSSAKKYAERQGVFLMGDLPFLVAGDSADVWTWRDYFKLDYSSGAPPDLFFAKGQRWGMPAYNWPRIASNGYDYLIAKLRYNENFYDFFRIDHVIGVYRLWTIPVNEPEEAAGLNGAFDPPDENAWEAHGRKILGVMLANTRMVPCGEDLGTVPKCSDHVLDQLGIPGMDVQRWTRDYQGSLDFKPPHHYRAAAEAAVSTHDTTTLRGWWRDEAGTVDEMLFLRLCREKGISCEAVCERLFDLEKSRHGRLRWREDVWDKNVFLRIVGRSEKDVGAMADMFRTTHDERRRFWKYLDFPGDPKDLADTDFVRRALESAHRTVSVLSVHPLVDWLSLWSQWVHDPWEDRINVPGTNDPKNWSFVFPLPVEALRELPIHKIIREMNISSHREIDG